MRDIDPVADAIAALLRTARPGRWACGAWASERRSARDTLRAALAAARLEPAAGLEFVDVCSGAGVDRPGERQPGPEMSAIAVLSQAADDDAAALRHALGGDALPRQIDCDLVVLAAGPLDDDHDGALISAAAQWFAGARPAVVAAVAEVRAAVDAADAATTVDAATAADAATTVDEATAAGEIGDGAVYDFRAVAARTETIVGLLSVADVALGGASLERIAATAFIGDGDVAAAAAFALIRRGDAPAQLALAAVLAVALAVRGDPIVFGDFSVVASAIAHKFRHGGTGW